MNAAELIRECRRRGVRLLVQGSELRYVGPRLAVDQEIVRELRAARSAVLSLLTNPDAQAEESDVPRAEPNETDREALLDRFEERAAIMEFDGGLSREEAEHRAWESVFGLAGAAP
jgi:hypothetical protein